MSKKFGNIKSLTFDQRVFLRLNQLDPREFMFISEDAESYTFFNIMNGKEVTLRR